MDWIFNNPGKVLIFLLVLFFGLGAMEANETEQRKSVFMAACLSDHKQYECDVMWNQASESKNTYIPVVIPAGR